MPNLKRCAVLPMQILQDDPTCLRTVCGLSTLIGILAYRAAQLKSLPQRVEDRNTKGETQFVRGNSSMQV